MLGGSHKKSSSSPGMDLQSAVLEESVLHKSCLISIKYTRYFLSNARPLVLSLPHIVGGRRGYNSLPLFLFCIFRSGLRIGYLNRGRVIFSLTGHNLQGSIQIPSELDHGGLDRRGFVFHLYPDRCILIREYGPACEGR